MRIVLASNSPRRKELLKSIGEEFEIIPSNIDEKLDEKKNHFEECMKTSKLKAKDVFDKLAGDVIVIGSDTIVSFDGKIYGKPKDYQDAFNMLKKFSNNSHKVISSLCLLIRKEGIEYEELTYDECSVYVSNMTDDEIDAWINSNDVYTKAGAYAIQEGFGKYISKIEGDYFSIVGLPVHKLYNLLKKYK